MKKHALLSDDGSFRYLLTREWDVTKPCLTFIMLNPSTADADTDDATIRKCIGFAKINYFGSIAVVNLFTFRTRDPAVLRGAGFKGAEAIDNLHLTQQLTKTICSGGTVCCAWGTRARWPEVAARVSQVKALMKDLQVHPKALRVLFDGTPSHPLMLSYSCKLRDYQL